MSATAVPTATLTGKPVTARRAPGRKRGDARTALFFLLPNGVGFLVFTITPLIASLVLSFFSWPLIGKTSFIGLGNYVTLLTKDTTFRSAVYNTLYFVAAYVPLNVVVAMGVAVWLQGYSRSRRILRVIFFVPVLTPLVADAVVWSLLLTTRSGLIDSVIHGAFHAQGPEWLSAPQWAMPSIIIVAVWQGFGYNMLLFTAGIHAIPDMYYDASKIDGASRWRTFWSVTVPLLSPSLFFGIVLTVITSFQVFDLAYILTNGGPGTSSTTLVYWLFEKGFNDYAMGYASAIAWLLFLMVIVITAIEMRLQRRWVHYES
jgi:multiple sugar transport system permease protein